jgi:hypothetical protein
LELKAKASPESPKKTLKDFCTSYFEKDPLHPPENKYDKNVYGIEENEEDVTLQPILSNDEQELKFIKKERDSKRQHKSLKHLTT